MGRGGGGGGSRSSGGGGGSRSFGGSSSHSSRSSFSSSSHRGGSRPSPSYHTPSYHAPVHHHHHTPTVRVTHHYHTGPVYGGGYAHDYYERRVWKVIGWTILIAVILIALLAVAGSGDVRKSTVEREKLKPYASFDKNAIDDDAGWITNTKVLQKGMESFYKETGVQPALAIYESIDGEKYLSNSKIEKFMNSEYDELIGHERGVLLLFCEYADSDYYAYYLVGEDAQTVMDSEAEDILMDYVHDLYTNSSLSDEEYFAQIFEKTGERIMTVTPTVASKIPVIIIGIVAIVIIFALLKAQKAKHEREAEKAKETERILNSNIDRI